MNVLKIDIITNTISQYLYEETIQNEENETIINNDVLNCIYKNILDSRYINSITIHNEKELYYLSNIKCSSRVNIKFKLRINNEYVYKLFEKFVINNKILKILELKITNNCDLSILKNLDIKELEIYFINNNFIDLHLLSNIYKLTKIIFIEDINNDVSNNIFNNVNILSNLECLQLEFYFNDIKVLQNLNYPIMCKRITIHSLDITDHPKYRLEHFRFLNKLLNLEYFSCNFFSETIDLNDLKLNSNLQYLYLWSEFFTSLEALHHLPKLKKVKIPYFNGYRKHKLEFNQYMKRILIN